MTSYTTISNALVAVGAKPFATTVQAFRDNPLAIAEADSTAPVNQTVWHPYNKVTNGDANDGKIYDFAVSGAVANVVSPDFADGYEYRFRLDKVSLSSGGQTFRIELYRETSAAYDAATVIHPAVVSAGDHISGFIEVLQPRQVLNWCPVLAKMAPSSASGVVTPTVTEFFSVHTTAQKRLRARFSWASGNIDAGQIFMDRRRLIV